jgi:AraC-like DNA-binding protein
MSAHPTFYDSATISIDHLGAERRQSHECRFCRGTGRVYSGRAIGPRTSGFPRHIIRRIEELLDPGLPTRQSVAELASTIGYSASHFFRMFRRSFGITPHTYLMQRRLAMAQELLMQTDRCIADIALNAGFCDQAHLSRTFRRSVGTTPRAFRAVNRGSRESEVGAGLYPTSVS